MVVVGSGTTTRLWSPAARGSFGGFGVDVEVRLGAREEGRAPSDEGEWLPPSISIGAWLLRAAGWPGRAVGQEVSVAAGTRVCLSLGETLRDAGERVGLLVVADGAATGSTQSPGYLDDRAADVDRSIQAALASGDPAGLAAVDPVLARDLMVQGRAPLQVLAGAAQGSTTQATLRRQHDSLGVTYWVARWQVDIPQR